MEKDHVQSYVKSNYELQVGKIKSKIFTVAGKIFSWQPGGNKTNYEQKWREYDLGKIFSRFFTNLPGI